jgi:hypothetical protein
VSLDGKQIIFNYRLFNSIEGVLNSPEYMMLSRIVAVVTIILFSNLCPRVALPASGTEDQNAEEQQQRRQLNKRKRRWRTLKLLVDGAYRGYRKTSPSVTGPITTSYETGDMIIGIFLRDSSFGNNNIYNEADTSSIIGVNYQTCVTPMKPPINSFMCTWVLGFLGSSGNLGQVDQITAQGSFYNDSIVPSDILTIPTYQFVAITGGTGNFRSITGFIVISPRSLLDNPPKWWYYVVYRFKSS